MRTPALAAGFFNWLEWKIRKGVRVWQRYIVQNYDILVHCSCHS